jgi:Zn-dependent protease
MMRVLKRFRSWSMQLPSSWGQANIHGSLLTTLVLLSVAMLALSFAKVGFAEFRSFSVTLPIIWVISLAVRIAAQHAAIGGHSLELETLLGPTGNLSTHYEDLPPKQIFKYAIAGHASTFSLAILGAVISAALIPTAAATGFNWSSQLDIHGGFNNRALASQIMWVNLFIGMFNLLPTVPFDNRALLYALLSRRRQADEPGILRKLAFLNSHLACIMVGWGLALLFLGLLNRVEYIAWYALIAASVYLFVSSRLEAARSRLLEEQYMPFVSVRKDSPQRQPPAPNIKPVAVEPRSRPEKSAKKVSNSDADLDEILRKLHREGTGSLSDHEQEALLKASQKLKEKRSSRRD